MYNIELYKFDNNLFKLIYINNLNNINYINDYQKRKHLNKIRKHLIGNISIKDNLYFFIKLPSINVRESIKYHKLLHTKDNLFIDIDNDVHEEYKNTILEDIKNYNIDKDYIFIDSMKTFNKLTKKTSKQSKTT